MGVKNDLEQGVGIPYPDPQPALPKKVSTDSLPASDAEPVANLSPESRPEDSVPAEKPPQTNEPCVDLRRDSPAQAEVAESKGEPLESASDDAFESQFNDLKACFNLFQSKAKELLNQYPEHSDAVYESYLLPAFLYMSHQIKTNFQPTIREEGFRNPNKINRVRQALAQVFDPSAAPAYVEMKEWCNKARPVIESVAAILKQMDAPIVGKLCNRSVILPALDQIGCEYVAAEPLLDLTPRCETTAEGVRLTVSGTAKEGSAGSRIPVLRMKLSSDPAVLERVFPVLMDYRKEVIEEVKERYQAMFNDYEKKWTIAVKPDPEKMWNYIAADRNSMQFWKEDEDYDSCGAPAGFNVIGGSQKGRSHWHVGSARDDDFAVAYDAERGWNLLVVCDGAGSKKYSREGSKIVANSLKENVIKMITPEAEASFRDFVINKTDAARDKARHALYHCFILTQNRQSGALHRAFVAVRDMAASEEKCTANDFATTLLCVIVKKFEEGWFFGSFMVGDGAVALYDNGEPGGVLLLGDPDEGEFSGQTCFFTMDSVWTNANDLWKRLRVETKPDFTALFLMTDGVSDPKFETTVQLSNKAKWKDLYNEIYFKVLQNKTPQEAAALLGKQYLKFYSEGNHDDRTLVMMYRGEQ